MNAFCCGTTTAVFAIVMRTRSAKAKPTIIVSVMGVLSAFGHEDEREAVHALHPAAGPSGQLRPIGVLRGPYSAAQLGAANLSGLDLAEGRGNLADEVDRIDLRRLHHAQDAASEDQHEDDARQREHDPLDFGGAGQVERGEEANEERAHAEENQVEAA